MKLKKIMSAILAAAMLTATMAACGGDGNSSAAPSSSTDGNSATNTSAPAESGSGVSAEDLSTQEEYTVKIMYFGDAKTEDTNEVAAKLSELTKAKYNTVIEMVRVGFGSYKDQANLALNSGEKLDVISSFGFVPATMMSQNQILPLNDYLDQYAPDTKAAISDLDWQCVTINGNITGVPYNIEKASSIGLLMVKDVVDAMGIDWESIKTLKDAEPIFEKVKAEHPEMYMLIADFGDIRRPLRIDSLCDDSCLGVLEDALTTEVDPKVVNLFETASYVDWINTMYDFNQKGYMQPDAASSTESANSLLGAGKAFSFITNIKPGIEAEWVRNCGKEVYIAPLVEEYSTSANIGLRWCIANNSEKPERAMQVINEMYMNPDFSNIFIYGIEGKHWKFVDEEQGVVGYADGVEAGSTGYSNLAWGAANEQISYVFEGDDPDLWKKLGEFNANAPASVAKGFVWDNADVINEVTSCTNVLNKYVKALQSGALNPETDLGKFNQELRDAGLDTIIQDKQSKLDAWMAENK